MWSPRPEQVQLAIEGYSILKEHAIVYYAMEERSGKTFTAILTAEFCSNVETVVVITTAKAMDGWIEHFDNYIPSKEFILTTFGKAKNVTAKFDLAIIDEAHKNISSYPKPSATWKSIAKLVKNKPIIYLSATPHAQGYQQMYHQLALSSWSPWKKYSSFYNWFKHYGIPSSTWINGREVQQYTKTVPETSSCFEHLMIVRTRKELDFPHEPEDKVHYVELTEWTKRMYNELLKERLVTEDTNGITLVADSPMKLRSYLHMLEGGVAKQEDEYFTLPNTEKIDYIKETWGDLESMCIFYNYKQELVKLKDHFKHALILQATSYAEGVDLTHIDTLIVYSQNFSTAQHTQRRARQAGKSRDKEIVVHFLLVQDAISEQCYETVAVNKTNFVDSVFERKEL